MGHYLSEMDPDWRERRDAADRRLREMQDKRLRDAHPGFRLLSAQAVTLWLCMGCGCAVAGTMQDEHQVACGSNGRL